MPLKAKNSQPCVSVLMTAYNSEKFIANAIVSVLKQTYKDFELIIVDDDSEDATFDVANDIAKKDQRIRLYKNAKNVGDYANRAIAANYACGKYIKCLDSDNYLYPHALDVMVSCMEKYPDAGLGLCKLHEPSHPLPDVLSPVEVYRETFFKGGVLTNAPSSTIIRAKIYHAVGGFQNTRHRGDFELWLKLAAAAPVVRIPGYLEWTGTHPEQESNKNTINKVAITYNITTDALHNEKCPLSESEKNKALNLYKRRFMINTFIKRPMHGEFSIRDLLAIYHLLKMSKKKLFSLCS